MLASRRRVGAALCVIAVIVAAAGFRAARARPPAHDAPGGVAITKGPYLQALGPTGVTIKVELTAPAPARVEVYAAGGAAALASASDDGAGVMHAIRVDGLRPATTYEYAVSAGEARAERGRFTTAPGGVSPYRFLVYGDSRSDPAAHAAVVRAMAGAPADFLVNTGDMVSRGGVPDDWRELFAIEGPMLRDRCVFAAVGNHELVRGDEAGGVAFLRYFGDAAGVRAPERLYGSFRWSNTRFFVLNAMDTWTGAEHDWLRDELDRAMGEPGLAHRVAVMHWGPYSSGTHGGNPALANGELVAMMRARKVELVLAGHDHIYERGRGGGLNYVVSGGGGAPLYEQNHHAPETLVFEPAYHFVEVAVDGEKVSLVARRASGGVIDACGFVGAGAWSCDAPAAH